MLMYGGTPFGWSLTPGYTWSVFVKQFYLPIAQATPHLGYYSLHAISEKYFRGKVQIVTMNVDGLHQASGFSDDNVSEGNEGIKYEILFFVFKELNSINSAPQVYDYNICV